MSNLLKKGLAMLLAVLMLAALLPATALAEGDGEDPADAYVNGEDTQPDDLQDEEDLWDSLSMSGADDSDQIAVYAVTHNYTEVTTSGTRLSGKWNREYRLSGNITVMLEDLEIDFSTSTSYAGMSPITLADNANVTLVISGTVTLKGGNARNINGSATGAGAAIRVPKSATLTILSAHDDRSAADANGKPTDTLAVYGGNAAPGRDGIDADAYQTLITGKSVTTILKVGGGGSGGGGAAAAIGGNGGDGGRGGIYGKNGYLPTTSGNDFFVGTNQLKNGDFVSIATESVDTISKTAVAGNSGESGEVTGTIRVVGFLNLTGSGGLAAAGGKGGDGGRSMWTDRLMEKDAYEAYKDGTGNEQLAVISGPGGGGGGGGGLPAPFIGCGGAGGSGGGSGGAMSIGFITKGDTLVETGWYGGGGGGGGWPNGSGGGAGSGASVWNGAVHAAAYAYKGSWPISASTSSTVSYTVLDYTATRHPLYSTGIGAPYGGEKGLSGNDGSAPSLSGVESSDPESLVGPNAIGAWNAHEGLGATSWTGTGGSGGSSSSASSDGSGGNGGGRVSAALWGSPGNSMFTLSTSVKMDDFSGYMDSTYVNRSGCWADNSIPTCFGDGGGYGGRLYTDGAPSERPLGAKPVMLFDLRDCDVSVTGSYTCDANTCSAPTHYYNGQTHIPGGVSVAYTGDSDKNSKLSSYFYMEDSSLFHNFDSSEYVIVQSGDLSAGSSVTASDYINCPGTVVVGGAVDSAYQEALAARDYSAIFTKWPNGLLTGSFSGYTTGHPAIYALLTGTKTVEIGIQQAALGDFVIAAKGDHLPNVNNNTAPADEYTTAANDDTAEMQPFAVSKSITLGVGTISTDKKTVSPTVPYTSGGNTGLSVDLITGTGGTCTWTVTGPDGTDCTGRVLTGTDGLTPTFTAATPGMYTVTLTLSGMTNFEDKTVTTKLFVRQVFAPVISGTAHPGCVLTAKLPGVPEDVAARAEYVWMQNGTGLSSGTGLNTYTPTADKAKGGPITVTVKPADADKAYIAGDSSNSVELKHSVFNSNGFCEQVLADGTTCGEYEQPDAEDTESGTCYHIANAGQLFWFAAMVNGESAHAYTVEEKHPNISGVLETNIDLLQDNPNAKNNHAEWTPIGCTATLSSNVVTANGFSGTFDGGGNTVTNMYISTASSVLGFVGYLAPGGKVTNLTVNGLIAPGKTNRNGNAETGIGGIVGQASGSAAISDVISDVTITGDALYHVGGIVGCMRHSGNTVPTLTRSFYGIPYADKLPYIDLTNSGDSIGGIVGCADGNISYCGSLGNVTVSKGSADNYFVGGGVGQILDSPTLKSCFSYGALTGTGSGTIGFGLFAGFARVTDVDIVKTCAARAGSGSLNGSTNNVYTVGMKNGGNSQSALTFTTDEFSNGRVCYTLNGNTSEDTVWRQNVDNAAAGNGADPQAYPNLSGTAGIVYRHTETKYSNTEKVVFVSISWGSMAFTYKAFENGAWDPTTHDDKHTWVAASNDADAVTVSTSADTNVDVNATFSFTPEADFKSKYSLTGTLKNGDSVINSPTTVAAGGDSVTAKLEIASGVIPQDAFSGTQTHIGTVTIGLTTD